MDKIERDRPQAVIKARIKVRLARDMDFNNPPGRNIKRYVKYTQAEKVPYNSAIMAYLNSMEDSLFSEYKESGVRAVAIFLDGMIRYVWRSDLLTEEEFENGRKARASSVAKVLSKSVKNVGKGRS